jgi:hypothetical protein
VLEPDGESRYLTIVLPKVVSSSGQVLGSLVGNGVLHHDAMSPTRKATALQRRNMAR